MVKAKVTHGTLHERTLQLLEQNQVNGERHTMLQIYDATGVKPDWIRKFRTGRMPNPSVNRVQALYEFLAGRTLAV